MSLVSRFAVHVLSYLATVVFRVNVAILDAWTWCNFEKWMRRIDDQEDDIVHEMLCTLYQGMGRASGIERHIRNGDLREDVSFEDPVVAVEGWRNLRYVFESIGLFAKEVQVLKSVCWRSEERFVMVCIVRYKGRSAYLDLASRIVVEFDEKDMVKSIYEDWAGIPFLRGEGLVGRYAHRWRYHMGRTLVKLVQKKAGYDEGNTNVAKTQVY